MFVSFLQDTKGQFRIMQNICDLGISYLKKEFVFKKLLFKGRFIRNFQIFDRLLCRI